MKRIMTIAVAVMLACGLALANGTTTLTFVGAACSGDWKTDLYLVGDSSGTPGPQTVELKFIPFGGGSAYTITVDVPGDQPYWRSTALNVVCHQFGSVGTGVLTVTAPFDIDGWCRTWSPPGYGQALADSTPLQYATLYELPFFQESKYRCNLLLYNESSSYTIASVGFDWVFIEPYEAVILTGLDPGTTFSIESGGLTHATVSLVDEATNDAVTVPLVQLE